MKMKNTIMSVNIALRQSKWMRPTLTALVILVALFVGNGCDGCNDSNSHDSGHHGNHRN